jgi:hypothetical protein
MTIYPVPLHGVLTKYEFANETDGGLTAAAKQQILSDWRHFILNGFKRPWLTDNLFDYLFQRCGLTEYMSAHQFWEQYVNSDANRLAKLIQQFGGDRRHALDNSHAWLNGATADLKAALCDEMTPLAPPLLQVLADLQQQHEAMIRVWRDFAQQTAVSTLALPPAYQISANTRHLLAYAAHIAHKRPLQGLQTMMFAPTQQILTGGL